MISSYQPFYIWPNKAFPFRHYFKSETLDIFFIENIVHNYEWLYAFKDKINDKHFFFVLLGWYHDSYFVEQYETIFTVLKLKKENFFFLYNSLKEQQLFEMYGFFGELINQNCWLDENTIQVIQSKKEYNAINIARKALWKRHHLASKVNKLALIAGGDNYNADATDTLPPHTFNNTKQLTPEEVYFKISQSHCGLCLSQIEGACYSSSEYLLCGIPVVSTVSKGGRDVWYNDYNSIICEDTEQSVANAVEQFVGYTRDANIIRNMHITQSLTYRKRFISILQDLFKRKDIKVDAYTYFKQHFFNKMRVSYTPDFNSIFE